MDAAAGTVPSNSIVIIDFGQPDCSDSACGTDLTPNDDKELLSQDYSTVENFGNGFLAGVGSDETPYTTVILGTSNDGSYMDSNASAEDIGKDFANEVNDLNTWNVNYGNIYQLAFAGGIDAEQSYNAYGPTSYWATGWSDNTDGYYYAEYGSASGCPENYTIGGCNDSWTQTDIYDLSWGNSYAYPVPQIYNDATALEWGTIAAEIDAGTNPMWFLGPMDQHQACADKDDSCSGTDDTANEAFDQLYEAEGQDYGYIFSIRYDLAEPSS